MTRAGRKPVIGLSLGLHDFGDYAGVGFQRPVALAGGVGLGLPRVNGYLEDALDVCDGVLLGGGRDIDPSCYGQAPSEHLTYTEPRRDAFELELVERALDRGLPILGMCRGIQMLNVALGGTLVQDVALEAGVGRASIRSRLEGLEGGRARPRSRGRRRSRSTRGT